MPVILLIAFAVTRWPDFMPPNFSAAYALAFCAGAYFPARYVLWVPLVVMLGSDMIINVFYYKVAPVGSYMLVSYSLYALLIVLGRQFGPKAGFFKLLSGGILGAFLFYVISNTFAWMGNPAYLKTFEGWIKALTTGMDGFPPTWIFLKNTLLSGGLFTGLFVGAMKAAEATEREPELKEEEEKEETEKPEGEEAKA
ncbi:MAG: hypothetical protein K0Q55_3502 [Verrucomicrobia bacterium]|nr:hypothetical protein [Verrucomicrobiota bacterium]